MHSYLGKLTTVALLPIVTTAAVGVASGNARSAPDQDSATVGYRATTSRESVLIETDLGSLVAEDGVFRVKARGGTDLAGAELSFRVDDFIFPIAARISGHTATLTPQFDLAHAIYQPVEQPFEDGAPWQTPYDRERAAWDRMTSTIALGATIGTVVGGIGGAAVGCLLGGLAGAGIAAATIVGMFGPFLPAAAIGCLGGIVAVGALGAVAGQLLIAAPIAAFAAVQYFTTINEPFTPSPRK